MDACMGLQLGFVQALWTDVESNITRVLYGFLCNFFMLFYVKKNFLVLNNIKKLYKTF